MNQCTCHEQVKRIDTIIHMSSSLSIDIQPDSTGIQSETMNGKSRQLVTNEPVECEK